MGSLGKIEHIVVLMLENRSFDNLLGYLYPKSADFDGLDGTETNPDPAGVPVPVSKSGETETDGVTMSMPTPNGGEAWSDMNEQQFRTMNPSSGQFPTMDGFVVNYMRRLDDAQPSTIMHCFTPKQVPVISTLAKAFAVCDQWFASAPCQTWPNRFFAHTGTACGYEDNTAQSLPNFSQTVFNQLLEHRDRLDDPWRVYYHDFSHALLTLTRLWPHMHRFKLFEDAFEDDATAGDLPAYTFIEPQFFPAAKLPNDEHPPHNVAFGEALIARTYNALRASPLWKKTLFIVIFDEHGGCFDHVPPPLAVRPDNQKNGQFAFDRYGIRVPAVIISPYVKPGTVLRATPAGSLLPRLGPPFPFDHTSIIATLRRCFDLVAPLTNRDSAAPDLDSALELDAPDNSGPVQVPVQEPTVSAAELVAADAEPINDLQLSLRDAAAHLPDLSAVDSPQNKLKTIESHLFGLTAGLARPQIPVHTTTGEARDYIAERLGSFLESNAG